VKDIQLLPMAGKHIIVRAEEDGTFSYWNHSCGAFIKRMGAASEYGSERLARAIFNRLTKGSNV
jgi:hypothetical protein